MNDDDLSTRLARLNEPPAVLPMPAPADVRRHGLGMRRRRTALWSGGVVAVALAVVLPLTVGSSPARPGHPIVALGSDPATGSSSAQPAVALKVADTSGQAVELVAKNVALAPGDSAATAAVVAAEQSLTIKLMQRLDSDPSSNVVFSPSSLSTALAMLTTGARGETQRQLTALLGGDGSSATQIASGWSDLVAQWATAAAAAKITLSSANSVWLQKGASLTPSFMTDLAKYFSGGVWQSDFAGNPTQAAADLDAWVSRQTHGKIPQLLSADEVQNLLLVLVNAVYFQADWQQPFDGHVISSSFTTASGAVEQVPTMTGEFHTSAPASYLDDGVTAVELPYADGRFAALMIEPVGTSLPKYLAALTPATLTALTTKLRSRPADVQMPTLSLNTTAELADPLKALGVTDVFKSGQADLTGLSPQADHVAFVKQQATLDVDTKGTTASAATAIGVEPTSASADPPIELTFDHPFLFLILDTTTGGILFGSAVNNPTAH